MVSNLLCESFKKYFGLIRRNLFCIYVTEDNFVFNSFPISNMSRIIHLKQIPFVQNTK